METDPTDAHEADARRAPTGPLPPIAPAEVVNGDGHGSGGRPIVDDPQTRAIALWEHDVDGAVHWCAPVVDEFLILRDTPPYRCYRASIIDGDHDRALVVGAFRLARDDASGVDVIDELLISAAYRRRGIAGSLLRHLLLVHDLLGRDLLVLPANLHGVDPVLTLEELAQWYGRYGFTPREDQSYLERRCRGPSRPAEVMTSLQARRAARLAPTPPQG